MRRTHHRNQQRTQRKISRRPELQRAASQAVANQLSVQQELQADCFAGLWANHANRSRQVVEQGDIEEAVKAAQAIGDDTLQQQGQGYVRSESFTHGSAAQRMERFQRGGEQCTLQSCNTFATNQDAAKAPGRGWALPAGSS